MRGVAVSFLILDAHSTLASSQTGDILRSLFLETETLRKLNWHSWILKILSRYFSVEFTHLFLHKQSDATGNHLLHLVLQLKSCEKKLT